jgi:hypothetical protein
MEGSEARRTGSLVFELFEAASDEEPFETESIFPTGDAGCSSPEQRSNASIQS